MIFIRQEVDVRPCCALGDVLSALYERAVRDAVDVFTYDLLVFRTWDNIFEPVATEIKKQL